MSHLNFGILALSINFCPIKTDLSGNTVWPQASGFLDHFLAFLIKFCPNKTDLFGNTVWPQASGFQKLAKMDHF